MVIKKHGKAKDLYEAWIFCTDGDAYFIITRLNAQDAVCTRFFRLYIDDDFKNWGKGANEACSAGLNLAFLQ